jgi:6-phosphogluconolactonase (cycloisomerase 2 family)
MEVTKWLKRPTSVAVDPSNRFVYVGSGFASQETPGMVSAFSIGAHGELAQIIGFSLSSPYPRGRAPNAVVVGP